MHSFFTLRKIFFLASLSALFVTGCTRISSTEIGSGLIPAIDGVITKDTLLDVITDTFDETDSAHIYSTDNQVVGAITNDPLFGKTTATAYFELKPSFFPFFIAGHKDSIRIDSAVLILSYKGVFGDSMQNMTLYLSEIDKNTPLSVSYSPPVNYPMSINTVGSLAPPATFPIRRLTDSVNNRFENASHQIRIRVNPSVATRFIKTYDSTNAYYSDSAFRTYFAGFALSADPSTNALLKINLSDTNSKFALYYSTASTGATVRDTTVAKFLFSQSTCGTANRVVRDKSGSQFAQHVTTTSKPDSLVYVQTSPGSYVRVKVPGLQSLSNRIIHRAELVMEQVPDDANLTTTETYMLPPRYLLLSHYDSTTKSKRSIPNDYVITSQGYPDVTSFGGVLTYKAINGYDRVASYNFNLSRFVQGVVTRQDTAFTLRLSAPVNDSLKYAAPYPNHTFTSTIYLSPTSANDPVDGRVRLGGGSHSRFRMRLRVIFSRI